MDSWHQDWIKALESFAAEVGQFVEEVGREMTEAANALLQFSEEVAEEMADEVETALGQIDETLTPKLDQLDQQMSEWMDPVLQAVFGFEAAIDRAVEPVTHTIEPWLNQHPVCVGCRHYHGQVYNGNLLVCAMHPYGVGEDCDSCPDKELVSWSFPTLPPDSEF
ncbi:MAG: hypothetical protein IGS50_12130 [Synechococcales cyanobacterium C42_A2020_086]|nr:hypothetical protein [Synechococcales cyanobacterium C42_A2020_086]